MALQSNETAVVPSVSSAMLDAGLFTKIGTALPVKSSAASVTNITAAELQVNAASLLLLSVTVRTRVVPEAV